MKRSEGKLGAGLLALGFWLVAANAFAQVLPAGTVGSATNISSVMYFEPPHEQAVKMRLTSAEMAPLPGAMYDVKKLKIESFFVDGKLEGVAEAPRCTYAPQDLIASSSGPLQLSLRDGKIRTQGEGFLWQGGESSLYISNKVHTVIRVGDWKLITP